MLPPIFDAMELWGGPEGVEWMESKVPAPIMLIYRWVWTTDRLINSKGALAAVRDAQAPSFSLAGILARHAEHIALAVFAEVVVAFFFSLCEGVVCGVCAECGKRGKPQERARRAARRYY